MGETTIKDRETAASRYYTTGWPETSPMARWVETGDPTVIYDKEVVAYAEGLAANREAEQGIEVVICAAVRLPDGRVIRGHRHGDCIRTAQELVYWQRSPRSGVGGPAWDVSMAQDRGFVTSRNRYVGREEALQLQLAAGIPSACPSGYRKSMLFSEDLY